MRYEEDRWRVVHPRVQFIKHFNHVFLKIYLKHPYVLHKRLGPLALSMPTHVHRVEVVPQFGKSSRQEGLSTGIVGVIMQVKHDSLIARLPCGNG